MKDRLDESLARALSTWVGRVADHGSWVSTATLSVTLVLGVYAALTLGINSDNLSLVSDSLPGRIAYQEFSELFPNLDDALLIVIEAETPELGRDAADALTPALALQKEYFTDVYVPGGGSFFERNGLLYRSPDELDEFADQMARVQPVIAELERDPSIANFAQLVRHGLDAARADERGAEEWAMVLDRVGEATVSVYDEFPVAISWEEVLLSGSSIDPPRLRVIVAHPELEYGSLLAAGPALRQIRETAESLGLVPERGVTVRVTGNPALNYEEMLGLLWDIGGAGVFCFALVTGVLYLALRSISLVAAAVATLLAGLVWTAAFAAAAVGDLNVVSMTFAILFIGLGVDFGIHYGMRFADLLREGAAHRDALCSAAGGVGSSLVLCTLTTAIGFFVFVPTDYRGVAELGLIAGAGMVIILLLTLTFMPALISSWLPVDVTRMKRDLRFSAAWWAGFERHPRAVRWTALLAFVGACLTLPRAHFEMNVVDMRDPDTQSVQAFNALLEEAAMSPWHLNVVAPDVDSARRSAERLVRLDLVEHAVTLAAYVPNEQEEKLEILRDVALLMGPSGLSAAMPPALPVDAQVQSLRELHEVLDSGWLGDDPSPLPESMRMLRERLGVFLERVSQEQDPSEALAALERVLLARLPDQVARLRASLEASPIDVDALPAELVTRMRAANGRARVQIFPSENLQNRDAMVRFVDAVRSIEPQAVGVSANLVEFGRATIASFQQALASALVAIALLLWLLWRRVSEMLLVLAPLVLASVLTCATVIVLGLSFNFTNVIVLPLLFGIGVDSAIHLVHRARTELPEGESLLGTTTARAVFYSALTTTVSFGSLALSSHNGMTSLGALLTVGMIYTVLCNLIVLPALLGRERAGTEQERGRSLSC